MDQLNTHSAASLDEAFAPAEARRLAERLEIHYTPMHGSWQNMAKIELSVLGRQRRSRNIAKQATLAAEIGQLAAHRNADLHRADWRSKTEDARVKLHQLYPSVRLLKHCVVSENSGLTSFRSNAQGDAMLTDDQWRLIEPHILKSTARTGRPTADRRLMFEAALFMLTSGCPWRALPLEFGRWQTAFHHFNCW